MFTSDWRHTFIPWLIQCENRFLGCVNELANYEAMPDGPKLTVQDLERDGGYSEDSTAAPVFTSFVLEATERIQTEDNKEKLTSSTSNGDLSTRTKLIGYVIFFYSYSTWQGKALFLEDIYIRPDYRKKGYGDLLFKELAKHARDSGCVRIDFHVLAWNPAKEFYKRLGAENLTAGEQWELYRLTYDKFADLCED
ncbi:thialysine N-epsilon-acetyltransferase isoform X2 [Toxorhynchites rutilus septentrionalis]|uniref:thialysine N-epsilon-acetyltransferase isoform X2 n=1 Tax=Toxorhynchites rutilus septentrionalis TaxID=329112 RepID=UPI002478B96B|nr:thialysine N-epsilon-acetyltransferase isoform X2 [Toxorhynchites rutilus septentrionalis]